MGDPPTLDLAGNGLFAFKGVGGVGVGRSAGGGVGGVPIPPPVGPRCAMEGCGGEWFGVPVPRLFLLLGAAPDP